MLQDGLHLQLASKLSFNSFHVHQLSDYYCQNTRHFTLCIHAGTLEAMCKHFYQNVCILKLITTYNANGKKNNPVLYQSTVGRPNPSRASYELKSTQAKEKQCPGSLGAQ